MSGSCFRPSLFLPVISLLILVRFHAAAQVQFDDRIPKNVILMVGDGMGYNSVIAADYFFGPASFRNFPVQLAVSTHYAGSGYDPGKAWTDTGYITSDFTESAAAATALATGVKTSLNTVGLSPTGDTLLNLTEFAKGLGKSAGVVTSVPVSHATPAGFTAHNASRSNYPQIAFDILFKSRCDVVMGCGNPEYDANGIPREERWTYTGYLSDSATWQALKAGSGTATTFSSGGTVSSVNDIDGDGKPDPWTVITGKESFRVMANGQTPKRVLGIPEVHATLQQGRTRATGEGNDGPPFMTMFNQGVPALSEMAMAGLNVLDNNEKGFFLMIEGGAIDWANHGNQKGRMLEEMKDFRETVDSVIRWIETRSSWDETLLIITADHECGNLWGGPVFTPVVDHGTGNLPGLQYHSSDHTNALVPLFAKGAGAEMLRDAADEQDSARGPFIQNIEIPELIFRHWSLK